MIPLRVLLDHAITLGATGKLTVWVLDFQKGGAVAQLVERSVRNAEVGRSIRLCSIGKNLEKPGNFPGFFVSITSRLSR